MNHNKDWDRILLNIYNISPFTLQGEKDNVRYNMIGSS